MHSPQINADERRYKYSELTEQIIGIFYEVYNELGFGFLEKVYEEAMAIALKEHGLAVQQQAAVPVWFHGQTIGAYDADLIVNGIVLLELKACKALDPSLLNFGPRPQVRRFAFENERKKISVHLRKSAAK